MFVTDDDARAEKFVANLGPGSVAGPAEYVIQRIGELLDESVDEIMFGALPTAKA